MQGAAPWTGGRQMLNPCARLCDRCRIQVDTVGTIPTVRIGPALQSSPQSSCESLPGTENFPEAHNLPVRFVSSTLRIRICIPCPVGADEGASFARVLPGVTNDDTPHFLFRAEGGVVAPAVDSEGVDLLRTNFEQCQAMQQPQKEQEPQLQPHHHAQNPPESCCR
jgi:hypothetical protein